MGRASLTIAISGSYNGAAVKRAEASLERLAVKAAKVSGGMGAPFVAAGERIAEAGGRIYNLGQSMEDLGGRLTRGVTLPMAAVGGVAVKAATDFDTAFTNVKKTVDMDAAALEELKRSALELSKVQPVSAEDILNAEALGGQLGIANERLEDFAKVVSGLDIATDMDLEQAAMNLAQFANITQMSQADMEAYGSTIVALGNNMATTESQVSDMAMRVAAAGHQVGMSEADILGLSAALTSMGISAEAGGTAISTIMSQIDKDVATGSEGLSVWAETAGMSAELFAEAWRGDPVRALSDVLVGMDAATESGGNMALMLDELGITSLRQTDVMKRLAGNSEQLGKAVELANGAWQENAALQAEVDNRNESLASKFDVLRNRAHAVAVEVGDPLADALLEALDAAEPLIKGVEGLAESFADADEDTQRMIVSLAAAAAAAGPVLTVAGKVTKAVGGGVVGVGKLAQGFGVFRDALTTTNPKAVQAYQSLGTLATRLGLSHNEAVRAAGGVEQFLEANKGVKGAATEAGAALEGQSAKAGSLVGSLGAVAAGFGGITLAAGLANEAWKEFSGYNDLVEGASEARRAMGDFASSFDGVQAKTPELELAMGSSGRSVSTLSDTVDSAMRTIADTIESNLTEAGVITEEGAQRIADALEEAMGATAEKAQGYGAVIESYAATVGESLDASQFAQYVTDVNAAFDQGKADLDTSLNQQVQAIQSYHNTVGDVGSAAYQADLANAKSAHAQAVAELEGYKDSALAKSSEMFRQLDQDSRDGWGKARLGAEEFKTDMSAFWSSGPIYSGIYQQYVEGEFAQLTSDMDMGMTGAWMAAAAATVDAGGELDAASRTTIDNVLTTFDRLPPALQDEGDEAMRNLAGSIEAAGVELGDVSSMSGQQIVDALRGKFGIVPPMAAVTGSSANAQLAASLGNTSAPSAAAQGVGSAVQGAWAPMPGQASQIGGSAGASLAHGITGQYSAVSGAASYIGSAQSAADRSGSSYTWGAHLGSNLAAGIRSMWGTVVDAASSLAAGIASYLHQTTADVGPLSDTDVWGVHLAQNIERGMLRGVPGLERAARADAAAIERGFSPRLATVRAYGRSLGVATGGAEYLAMSAASGRQAASQRLSGAPVVTQYNNIYERDDSYVAATILNRSLVSTIGAA